MMGGDVIQPESSQRCFSSGFHSHAAEPTIIVFVCSLCHLDCPLFLAADHKFAWLGNILDRSVHEFFQVLEFATFFSGADSTRK
jgi:hypothetical protein